MPDIIDSPQERPIYGGNTSDDDPQVIDSLFQESQTPPDPAASITDPAGPLPVPPRRPTRILTGNILLQPTWDKPTLLLPEDLNRKRIAIAVEPTRRDYIQYLEFDPTTNPTMTFTCPYLNNIIVTMDVGAARIIGELAVVSGAGTFETDIVESASGNPIYPNIFYPQALANGLPARADGTHALIWTNVSGTGFVKLTAIGHAGDADFINLSDDPAKLEQDPAAGRIHHCPMTDVLPDHTGAVWVTARNSFGPIRVSYWGVTS
ncbi:MAG TPA: hypothetical protein VJ553_05625 [Candidatus Paceibacterota bacterium]|nr:hypothetical protein [Candidatus Paceibacterota bacterium]